MGMLSLLLIPALMQTAPDDSFPTVADLDTASRVIGIEFEQDELEQMRQTVRKRLGELEALRNFPLSWKEPFSLGFNPLLPGVELRATEFEATPIALRKVDRPDDLNELAFSDIPTLASLIQSRQVSCLELTELYLARLVSHDESLNCVVTLTEDRALTQARELDRELEAGNWRGLLHGIPYGAKDLLSVAGTPTTWGAKPYESQVIESDASVIQRLDQAGAVLVAKLSLGALAMGDEWFRGRTNNPWNVEAGSSGSSAGSASATAAGLVPFAIGSETLGSIVSPSVRCANSSLRPTFGRVPRGGAMPLSWTMDKLGILATSAVDCAIVLGAIHGTDGIDPDAVSRPYELSGPADVKDWRVGILREDYDEQADYARTVEELEALGVEIVELEIPQYPVWQMMLILMAEAACSFDELTRNGRDDQLIQQGDDAWPNLFRAARLIPAVEYVRANRMRTALCRDFGEIMQEVDAVVHGPFASGILGITNLTGHPCVVVPAGEPTEQGQPSTASFTGQLFGEAKLLALVQAWQNSTSYDAAHPEGF
jgi:Asp-tRNA(Asn)/Glu-tRNA(Gln) amidotransferase A subunit family amidase